MTLGAAVGGAFALLIVVIVIAYCIYMYRHPERHKLTKVQPDKNVKTGKYLHSFYYCKLEIRVMRKDIFLNFEDIFSEKNALARSHIRSEVV